MRLLVDNDAFRKLGAGNVFLPLLDLLGVTLADCRRLESLISQMTRGAHARDLGPERAARLRELAVRMTKIPQAPADWTQRIIGVEEARINDGEARLLALAVVTPDVLVLTGDKKAVSAIRDVPGLAKAIAGRVICLEAALLALCEEHGVEWVRARCEGALELDGAMRNCLPSAACVVCLESHCRALGNEAPGVLWGEHRWRPLTESSTSRS